MERLQTPSNLNSLLIKCVNHPERLEETINGFDWDVFYCFHAPQFGLPTEPDAEFSESKGRNLWPSHLDPFYNFFKAQLAELALDLADINDSDTVSISRDIVIKIGQKIGEKLNEILVEDRHIRNLPSAFIGTFEEAINIKKKETRSGESQAELMKLKFKLYQFFKLPPQEAETACENFNWDDFLSTYLNASKPDRSNKVLATEINFALRYLFIPLLEEQAESVQFFRELLILEAEKRSIKINL